MSLFDKKWELCLKKPGTRKKKFPGPVGYPTLLIPATLVPVPAVPPTDNYPKPPFRQTVRGVMEKGGLKPLKPRKTLRLSNGAFLKNPAKHPDSIGTVMWEETAKGVHFNLFRSRVSFRFKS